MKKENGENKKRILGRKLAKELTAEDLQLVAGGTTSCSDCRGDDCDQIEI